MTPVDWERHSDARIEEWVCLVCRDGRFRPRQRLEAHELTDLHQLALTRFSEAPTLASRDPSPEGPSEIPLHAFAEDGLRNLLYSLSGGDVPPFEGEPPPMREADMVPASLLDWNLDFREPVMLDHHDERQAVRRIAQELYSQLEDPPESSDEELQEWSDEDVPVDNIPEPTGDFDNNDDTQSSGGSRKRARRAHNEGMTSRHWYPWSDRITCTLDILMHLPRSVFSHRQLDLFLWLLKVNQVDDVPSVKSMQSVNAMLQKVCGIETIAYDGALGHKYYVNNLSQIIAQEMANPKVRPHLSFYPEDAGKRLSEARQGARWLHEVPSNQLTPMARIGHHNFYIYEPAMLNDGNICMPSRWFSRGDILYAKCWTMHTVNSERGSSWRVCMRDDFEVPETQFLKNFPALESDRNVYGLPSFGSISAGLPRVEAQKEFNIHFLSTSNLAPPLEMLDGIIDQLEHAQKDGIWAWDCVYNEPILVIPMVLALLGDNPMQSEFACHIGMRGKYFCRACWVKGSDALDADMPAGTSGEQHQSGSEAGDSGNDAVSDAGSGDKEAQPTSRKPRQRKAKFKESLRQLVDRVTSFIKVGKLRSKPETVASLRSQFTQASIPGSTTRVKAMRTQSGIKDTYQLHFVEQLLQSVKGKQGESAKQAAIDAKLDSFPSNITSPVWRINGLDPHQDTPVEILHVILLGFVKYFWRDLVQNQLKNKKKELALLETRLSCFDVSGLGISPIAGSTLVQYSGSLTGRDFRVIAQVAPFVAYDLVSPDCFAAWVSLSKLIPLIWQPQISDIDAFIALLRQEINNFLLCTARWTARWFNKPKFHILVHLPDHIQRFGPAILFATEAFESFNAIIRAKSVHSNRHAPSRDIAQAFAQGNRIRHLLSSGLFPNPDLVVEPANDQTSRPPTLPVFPLEPQDWHTIGSGPRNLVANPSTVTSYLGLSARTTSRVGSCTSDKRPPRPYSSTLSGQKCPDPQFQHDQMKTFDRVVLLNGDDCNIGQYVIARGVASDVTVVAVVREIIRPHDVNLPPSLLLQQVALPTTSPTYDMPVISLSDSWFLVSFDMRDATHIQRFRPTIQPLDEKLIVEEAAVREFNSRAKQPEFTTTNAPTSRSRTTAQVPRSRLADLRGSGT
ncbi:hypothetical protein EYR40_001783 [Pleurotus pulmonarius]|nr:hypothetical protein EYR40_001783 [Pleurotus pulmonarius]